jgi:hypothetical protein
MRAHMQSDLLGRDALTLDFQDHVLGELAGSSL